MAIDDRSVQLSGSDSALPDDDYRRLALRFAARARNEPDLWLARAYCQIAAGYAALARRRDRTIEVRDAA
jgi:hypothetical protein